MALQWVDITTIDNTTPFMKVRWKAIFLGGDCWFSESPGLVTDNMSWTDGTKDYGWFSAHRLNSGSYSCSFNFDHTAEGYWNEQVWIYRDSVVDAGRSVEGFYDTAVTIDNETYYEIDFSLWSGATGYQLYAPYSTMPWAPGEVYVYAGSKNISVEPTGVTFTYQGGSSSVTVTAESEWSAYTGGEPWCSVDTLSGTSGTTVITITGNSGTTSAFDWIVFNCSGDTIDDFYIRRTPPRIDLDKDSIKFKLTGGTSVVGITADLDWSATTSEQWLSISPASGTSATTGFTVSADTYTGGAADRTGTITVSDGISTKTISITQKYKQGADGLYIGGAGCDTLYLGTIEIEALYKGGQQIF